MKIRYLIPALGISGIIVWLSSLPANTLLGNTSTLKQYLANFAHIPAYALLSFFWLKSFKTEKRNQNFFPVWALVFIGLLLFAVADELHQLFVSDRTLSEWDIALDVVGILFGFYLSLAVTKDKGFIK